MRVDMMNGPQDNDFFEEDDEDLLDGQLPIVCNAGRHTEKIEGLTLETQTWRMKERVHLACFVRITICA